MKKFFQVIGTLSLISFSFFFTQKTASVVKEQDRLMVELKEKSKKKYNKPINADVHDNTIIPGIYGSEVDIEKSYYQMKKVGSYTENLLVFKNIKPAISIENNYTKYIISGNNKSKNIGLIFLVKTDDMVDEVIKILKNKNISATFFIDGNYAENNVKKLELIKINNHTLGNLSYNENYQDSSFIWLNTVIKKVMNMDNSYCYTEKEDKQILDICSIQKNYTVIPKIVIKDNLVKQIKKNMKNGNIISVPINKEIVRELPIAINYIKSKGYNVITLDELLREDR